MGSASFSGSCWLGTGGEWNTELQREIDLGPWSSQYHHLWEVLSHPVRPRERRKWQDPGLTGPKTYWIGALLDPYGFLFCLIFLLSGVAPSLAWGEDWKERVGVEREVRER